MAAPHRFTHLFSNGITCTFLFDPALHYHAETKSISPAKHWSRKFDDAEAIDLFPEYLAWAHTVHEEIADLIGGACTYLLQDSAADPPSWEFWVYRPGGQRECAAKGFGTFDWIKLRPGW